MRTIGIVTVGRSDYSIYLPILRRIQRDPDLRLHLLAGGMHLSPQHGMTVHVIEADGFPIAERISMLTDSDRPEDIATRIGSGVIGFSQAYARFLPDLLVVLGDRFEMYSAALAALPFRLPVAHIHGGEVTKGAMDDALRHSLTKLSHLHFVSTEAYARRVIQLGEEPWRVVVAGAPSLDNLDTIQYLERHELEVELGIDLSKPVLLITYHPVTLEYEQTETQIANVLEAVEQSGFQSVFTMPNADTSGSIIADKIVRFVSCHPNTRLRTNLGARGYFSLLKYASAMVGNSSSGIIEAPSFKLPVVNIGLRQEGRVRGKNVIDVPPDSSSILAAIRRALSPEFNGLLVDAPNPYKQNNSGGIIVDKLKHVAIDRKLLIKSFQDY